MLTQEAVIKKLYEQGDKFEEAFSRKQYAKAKNIYDTAERVALFIELPQEHMRAIFQSQGESEDRNAKPVWGVFNQTDVRKAYEECIKKNKGFEVKPYEETYFGNKKGTV